MTAEPKPPDNPWEDVPVIYRYTRAQAIEDGVLVDVTESAKAEGSLYPVAMTSTLYHEAIRRPGGAEPEEGIKIDAVLCIRWLLRRIVIVAARLLEKGKNGDRVHFCLGQIAAWALCGPGDDGRPVLTVMLEGED